MKLKSKVKLGLIQGLALLICVSCEEPGRIGIDVDPDNVTFSSSYKSFNLQATLIQSDSVLSGSSGRLLVGRFNEANLGTVETKSYTQIWLNNPPNFPETSVYDSLVLLLPFDYIHANEITDINQIKIFRVSEDMSIFTPYYGSSELETFPDPIGEANFIYQTEIVDGEEVVRLDTILRVRLIDDLGEEIFEKVKDENDTTLDNINNWLDWFKGISIEAGDQYNSITGFNQGTSIANITLYYHVFDTEGEAVATRYVFTIENSVHFNNIKFDRTGSPLEGLDEFYKEFTAADNHLYIQAGTGLATKVDFTPFYDFVDSVGPMFINLGRLTLGKVEPFSQYLLPPETLLYYYTDSTNQWLIFEGGFPRTIQQDNPTFDATGVQFALNAEFKVDEDDVELNDTYSDGVSNTLQAMVDGRLVDRAILVNATPSENARSVEQVRINPQNIKLEVYYTTSQTNNNE